jgi:hypothetical protein
MPDARIHKRVPHLPLRVSVLDPPDTIESDAPKHQTISGRWLNPLMKWVTLRVEQFPDPAGVLRSCSDLF